MKSRWSDAEAAQFTGPLGPRVYTSRLLGRDKSLVLHGGGNTSVKLREKDVFGEEHDVLYVKGSGCGPRDHRRRRASRRCRSRYLQKLPRLPALSDAQMVNELTTHVLRAGRALAFGRDAAARHPAAQVRRPHARRRGARDLQCPGRREAHPRDLRRARRGDPLRHGGLRPRRALRARVPASRRPTKTVGMVLVLARHLFLRRRCARIVRAHDRAGLDGRGVPAEEEGLAHRASRRKRPRPAARGDRRACGEAISDAGRVSGDR